MDLDVWKGIGIVAALIALLVFMTMAKSSQESQVRAWCATHGYRVVALEHTVFDSGPFFRHKSCTIIWARIEGEDHVQRETYFRFWFGLEQAWKEGDEPPD